MTLRRAIARWPRASLAIALTAGCGVAFALWWFEPHKIFIDQKVAQDRPAEAAVIARGAFHSLEHATAGTAILVRRPDGRYLLRLEDLRTSNGPELRVLLSSVPAQDDWFVYDDGPFLDLGDLRGNVGSSNYEIPVEADLSKYVSAVVWCRRFSVGFGVAALER